MILDGQDPTAIARAAAALRAGELVAFPTETVYGLGADAAQDAAVAGIFRAKERPTDHPLIVHVAHGPLGGEALAYFAHALPPFALALARAFWPGPLTLIAQRRQGVGQAAAGGHDTIALRCPDHPVAQSLLAACAQHQVPGLAGPSANRFGRVSPTRASHVAQEFDASLLILDGGPCQVGIESAIVDCSRGVPVLMRPGVLTRGEIARACAAPLYNPDELAQPDPSASGRLKAHYAPQAPVQLMDAAALAAALHTPAPTLERIGVWARSPLPPPPPQVLLRSMPHAAAAAAQELFAVLREFDAAGAQCIWIETPPDSPAWEGVRDRLRRAAAA